MKRFAVGLGRVCDRCAQSLYFREAASNGGPYSRIGVPDTPKYVANPLVEKVVRLWGRWFSPLIDLGDNLRFYSGIIVG